MNTKSHSCPKALILQTVYSKLRFTLSYKVLTYMKMQGLKKKIAYRLLLEIKTA